MTTTLARKMPDGTICRTGPGCKRHGGANNSSSLTSTVEKQLNAARKAVSEKVKSLPFPEGSSRKGKNTSDPEWALNLYEQSREIEDNMELDAARALSWYKISGYKQLNGYLRGGREGHKKAYISMHNERAPQEHIDEDYKSIQRMSSSLDKAFDHEVDLPEGTLLYRSIKIDDQIPEGMSPLAYLKEKYAVGNIIQDDAYISTSADPDYMTFFGRKRIKAKGQHMAFEIVAKRGLPVFDEGFGEKAHHLNDGSIQSFEREILLNRGTKFRIVGVKNVTFASSYPEHLGRYGSTLYHCPKKVTLPVIQLEQI